jgi:hypothetical protein
VAAQPVADFTSIFGGDWASLDARLLAFIQALL